PLAIASFSFTSPPPPPLYTLSLHDALPISTAFGSDSSISTSPFWSAIGRSTGVSTRAKDRWFHRTAFRPSSREPSRSAARSRARDRKSTRLNSSHDQISYAVFCLKKKKKKT